MSVDYNIIITYGNRTAEPGGWQFGQAAYSYGEVGDSFCALLDRNNIEYRRFLLPEAISSKRALEQVRNSFSSPGKPLVHVCHSTFEGLRLIRGVYNIAWPAWEYDALVDDGPLGDMCFIKHFDEAWISCDYAAEFLRACGLKKVRTIKIPRAPKRRTNITRKDCFASIEALRYNLEDKYKVMPLSKCIGEDEDYLFTIINPWDYRKNLVNMINSFSGISESIKKKLLIKLVVDNKVTSLRNINDIVPQLADNQKIEIMRKKDKNIVFFSDYLSAEQLQAFHENSFMYLSLSHCECQNIPLVDAFLLGKNAIATRNTAMVDFIPKDYPFAVECERANLPKYVKELYEFKGNVHWFEYSEPSLQNAIMASCRGGLGIGLNKDFVSKIFSDESILVSMFSNEVSKTPHQVTNMV